MRLPRSMYEEDSMENGRDIGTFAVGMVTLYP